MYVYKHVYRYTTIRSLSICVHVLFTYTYDLFFVMLGASLLCSLSATDEIRSTSPTFGAAYYSVGIHKHVYIYMYMCV